MYALTHHDRSTERLTPEIGGPQEHTNHYPYPDVVFRFSTRVENGIRGLARLMRDKHDSRGRDNGIAG